MFKKNNIIDLINNNKLHEAFNILIILFNSSLDKKYDLNIKKKYQKTLVLKLKYKHILEKGNKILNLKKALLLIVNKLPNNFFHKFNEFEEQKLKKFSDAIEPKPNEAKGISYKEEKTKKKTKEIKTQDVANELEKLKKIEENRFANKQQIKAFAIDFIVKVFFLFLYSVFDFNIFILLLLQILPSVIIYFVLYETDVGVKYRGMSNLNKLLIVCYLILYPTIIFLLFNSVFYSIIGLVMYFRIFLTMEYYINYNEQEFFNKYDNKYRFF